MVGAVIQLYRGLRADDRDAIADAYEGWGFQNLNADLIDALTVWARFLLGPLLEDRERAVADEGPVGGYGRAEAREVRARLRQFGPVRLPREFVFMHRAALGLSGAFLHLRARVNFHLLFEEALDGFLGRIRGGATAGPAGAGRLDALRRAFVSPKWGAAGASAPLPNTKSSISISETLWQWRYVAAFGRTRRKGARDIKVLREERTMTAQPKSIDPTDRKTTALVPVHSDAPHTH